MNYASILPFLGVAPLLIAGCQSVGCGGGRADFILRATVQAINGIYNVASSPSRGRRADSRFAEVAELPASRCRKRQHEPAHRIARKRRTLYRDLPSGGRRDCRGYWPAQDLRGKDNQREDEPLLRIKSGAERPVDAYAATFYRKRWFWIDDTDLDSKRSFRFLAMFSSLAETGTTPAAPLLTIPAR